MTARRNGWSEWAVRVVALLFVVQGALLAFSQGASADTPQRDQFGNVLCLGGEDAAHGGSQHTPDKHAKAMACCTLGCSMFAGAAAPAPETAASVPEAASSDQIGFVSYANLLPSVPQSPRTARGPPAIV